MEGGGGGGGKMAQVISFFTCEYDQVQYTFFFIKYLKGSVSFFFFTCSLMCRCTFSDPSQSRSKWDPSFVGAVLSQGRAGLAGFESCPCRSSEGARDLFYIKAKIEGLAWKCSSDF